MLDKSFRCTNEILNFSLKFIEQSSQIKSFNRNGDSPKVYIADNSEIFIDEIVKEIKLCQEKGFQSICLICKTEKNSTYLFNKIKHKLDIQTQCFQYIPGKLPIPLRIGHLHPASPRRRFLTARSAKRLFF